MEEAVLSDAKGIENNCWGEGESKSSYSIRDNTFLLFL